nr:50S ribosomal protein L4P, large subunit ribosomal protein L4e [uncultured archaeon]
MEVKIIDSTNKQIGKRNLPKQFEEEVRLDLIKRALFALQSHKRQPYGSSPEAGKRHSVRISKRRRDYRGSYGLGISRTPRKIMARRGTRMTWTGAFVPFTVGGRRAHPPKVEKIWGEKINKKERRKAIRCAIAATMNIDLVKSKHAIPKDFPFLISQKFEGLDKTKSVKDALKVIGLQNELERVKEKKVRAGRGKIRGRKYKSKKGPLI